MTIDVSAILSTPPTGPGRCRHCHWHTFTMGYHPGCPKGLCRSCGDFAAMPGQQECAWCIAAPKFCQCNASAQRRAREKRRRRGEA